MAATVKADPSALIAQDAILIGDIEIGPGSIIHPKASIIATAGPIILGEDCVVEELAILQNKGGGESMRIGEGNQFMVGCEIQALRIGVRNTFHPKCRVAPTVAISDHCIISAGVTVTSSPVSTSSADSDPSDVEEIPPYTVIYGSTAEQRTGSSDEENAMQEVEERIRKDKLVYLREHLPKFVRMRAL